MTWHVEDRLTAPIVAEQARQALGEHGDFPVLLGRWSTSGPFADAYLQGLLALMRRNGRRVDIQVPPKTFTDDRVNDAFREQEEDVDNTRLTPTERLLSARLGGLVVGQLGEFAPPLKWLPKKQRDWLTSHDSDWGTGSEKASAVVVADGRTRRARPYAERHAELYMRLQRLLSVLGAERKRFVGDRRGTTDLHNLVTFVQEALENTHDHARLDLDGNPLRQVRFVQVRRFNVGGPGIDVEQFQASLGPSFDTYLAGLAERVEDHRAGRGSAVFAEVTIADGGPGIPALLANSLDIYERDIREERKRLEEALLPDRTTKSEGQAGRGQGLRKMLRATSDLGGLAVFRTGRCLATRTYLDNPVEDPEVFRDVGSSVYELDFSAEVQPLLAGSVVSLLFPLRRH